MSSSQLIRSAPLLLLAVLFVLTDCVTGQQSKIASTSSAEIEGLVDQLRLYPWEGPRNFTSPMHWVFNFTDPMCKILETGSAAQEILLRHLNDEGTKEQIIALLGGVGDAKSIEPIIHAMADEEEQRGRSGCQEDESRCEYCAHKHHGGSDDLAPRRRNSLRKMPERSKSLLVRLVESE